MWAVPSLHARAKGALSCLRSNSHPQQVSKRVVLLDDLERTGMRDFGVWGVGEPARDETHKVEMVRFPVRAVPHNFRAPNGCACNDRESAQSSHYKLLHVDPPAVVR